VSLLHARAAPLREKHSCVSVCPALLINGALAILVQALIGRRWRDVPVARDP
jgi:hypothetical protein